MNETVSEYPGLFELIWRGGHLGRPERGHNIYLPCGRQILHHRDGLNLRGHWTIVLMTLSLSRGYLYFSCEYV